MAKKKRGRKGTKVKVKGYYKTVRGKRVRVKGYSRKKPRK